jgi:hypothetical protein
MGAAFADRAVAGMSSASAITIGTQRRIRQLLIPMRFETASA